jgi:hypothetical protein
MIARAPQRCVRLAWLLLPMVLIVALIAIAAPLPAQADPAPSQSGPQRLYLPLITSARASTNLADLGVFGVEINRNNVAGVAGPLNDLRPSWVRYNGILWSAVEPTPGARNWRAVEAQLNEIAAIAATGAAPLVIVRSTPAWAQARTNTSCGPIRPDALPTFAAFVRDLTNKLSGHPYYVQYIEFGNEPDIDPALVPNNSAFGCWGDSSDLAGYGGAAYAAMLQAAYPAVKAVNPRAQVVFGGLLLDCDPTRDSTCVAGRFLEGVLAVGGGNAFDILAYHTYVYWSDQRIDTDLTDPKWAQRGGALLGKVQLLRETLARYGYSKPIMMNEGGLLCLQSSPQCAPNGFYADQANYAVRLFSRSIANDLAASVWYTLNGPGWQEGGLVDENGQPRPAFQAMRFLRERLANARYLGNLSSGSLEGYAFRTPDREYRIYWTNDATPVPLSLPAGRLLNIYNPTGSPLAFPGDITAGFIPIIVELAAE